MKKSSRDMPATRRAPRLATRFSTLRPTFRKIVPVENRFTVIKLNLDDLVDRKGVFAEVFEQRVEQRTLLVRRNLWDEDDQSGMDGLARIELSKIARVVRDEGEIPRDDTRHQVPVGFSAQSKPIDVPCFVAASLGDGDKGRMQTFID
jgi:hypothetical protein